MYRISLLLGGILLLTIIDFNWATKHHRDRGHKHDHDQESLLDKHEREREKKDRKKDEKKEEIRNITCYKCDGDLCRDPFRAADSIPLVQCDHSCWKGVFAASVRRSCGNTRCSLAFQGGSAISNTCCQTALCNNTQMKIPSIMILLYSFLLFFLQ